ncbi:MAPEG family protein [Alkalisalibacterium limincola]|uniref:Glutathione S-transferase n=1 Tax=Alkalisalibacterium limincola TaxID=2699169 RepID=A0A5C8KMT8_9GAMM|nr:MAPEG family protein [Alkalisalibacterium limincola]TXK60525.1 hypothetical protein FU658_12120 [Alkalisalibacterium limincola]
MPFPLITGLYAGLSLLLVLVLAYRVVASRRATRTGLGAGGSLALEQRIRAHGNAVEYLPMGLLGLLLLELTGHSAWLVHALGATLLLGRMLHAWGLSVSAGTSQGRLLGTLLTWLAFVAMAVLMVWRFFR